MSSQNSSEKTPNDVPATAADDQVNLSEARDDPDITPPPSSPTTPANEGSSSR